MNEQSAEQAAKDYPNKLLKLGEAARTVRINKEKREKEPVELPMVVAGMSFERILRLCEEVIEYAADEDLSEAEQDKRAACRDDLETLLERARFV